MADNRFGKENCSRAIDDMTNALKDCAQKVVDCIQNFASDTAQVWNDPNAVDFMKEVRDSFEKAIKEMNKNNKKFAEAASAITTMYLRVSDANFGGRFSKTPSSEITATIDVSAVKDHFPDGLVGSKMGEGQTLTDHINEAEGKIDALADEVQGIIKGANAFGNPNVTAAFGRTAKKVADILKDHAKEINRISKKYIDDTAANYQQVSVAATDSFNNLSSSA